MVFPRAQTPRVVSWRKGTNVGENFEQRQATEPDINANKLANATLGHPIICATI